MTREKKRVLSIAMSIVGVILLVIIIFSSKEFKALFAEETKRVEFNITDEQYVALNKFEYYDEGIIATKARNNWQKLIAKELGLGYEVRGEKAYGEKTVLYGGVEQEITEEVNGKEETDIVYDAWLALADENKDIEWVSIAGNGYDSERVLDVIINDDIITTIGYRWDSSYTYYSEVLISQYSTSGEKLSFAKTGIYGKTGAVVAVGDEYYAFVEEEVGINDTIYRISPDGTSEKLYVCGDKDKNERYTFNSMYENDGKLYLSGYSRNVKSYNLPQQELVDDFFTNDEWVETRQNVNGQYYSYLTDSKLTKLREVYMAVLFEYDIKTGECVELKRMDKRIGGDVEVGGNGEIRWNVEDIKVVVRPRPFDVIGDTEIVAYYYDMDGELLGEEKSDDKGTFVRHWNE